MPYIPLTLPAIYMSAHFNIERLPSFENAVITIGTFDGVHLGHRTILQQVVAEAQKANGESVLLTFEPHPRKVLFPDAPLKLLTPLNEKIKSLSGEGIRHIVVVPFTPEFANMSAEEYVRDFLVAKFRPKVIVIGYDHRFGHDRTGGIETLERYAPVYGYEVKEIPAQTIDAAAVSSTKIRHALNEGNVGDAALMLGRYYTLKGAVIRGAQLGRTIGYPTANISPADADQTVPARGVYAVLVNTGDATHKAMLNIGYRPTVSNEIALHIEAHLFDFNGDLYDKDLELRFVSRLRNEEKFPSLDALKEQLGKDKEAATTALAAL